MSLAASFRPLATELLRDLSGLQVTYTRVTPGTYDSATGIAAPSESASTVYGYIGSANRTRWGEQAVQTAQFECLLSAAELGFRPAPGDKLADTVHTLTVSEVKVISGGDADVAYRVLLKKG